MPKLKRLTTYTGSTLNPLYKHIKEANFYISPFDPQGNRTANFLITNFKYGDSRLKLPDFKLKVENNHKSSRTYMDVVYSKVNRE